PPRVDAVRSPVARVGASQGGRHQSAFFASLGVFFLTLLLASQVIGTMAEERNNKVIEILAAAVPLESVFLGKLLGMFGVAVLFIGFWGIILGVLGPAASPGFAAALHELSPAVGAAPFALLFAAYFATAFLLLGSVFLGLGAQATTMREIQLMSLPVTLLQVGMFGLSVAAEAHPGTWFQTAVELFPFSSSFAMAGHAAALPGHWRHLAALAWQLLWVTISIRLGARAFRRGVLQSGSPGGRWWRRRP
uniref:ABC transporter permease n=1 Tax=Sphingomonas bacterium TaxID=1895847 RepID=UPI00157604E5